MHRIGTLLLVIPLLLPAVAGSPELDHHPSDLALEPGGPAGAFQVAAWLGAGHGGPEILPLPPDAATSALQALDPGPWRAWLLELDAVRRTAGALHASTPATTDLASRAAVWQLLLSEVEGLLAARPAGAAPNVDVCEVVRVDGVGQDSQSTCTYLLEVDLGGDDTYTGNAGGSPPPEATTVQSLGAARPALAVDLAGDDTYRCTVPVGGCSGGGQNGVGALFDLGGNDTYDGTVGLGALHGGGGRWGQGLLVDLAGDDTYNGSVVRGGITGGAGFGGAGLHVDAEGEDRYGGHIELFGGITGGANDGLGVHVDLGGADVRSGTVDQRGGVNAGGEQAVGVLFDGGGAPDVYRGTAWGGGVNGAGVGGGGSYLLLDDGGDDRYIGRVLHHGAVNGAGYHAQAAHLEDLGGQDLYRGWVEGVGAVNGAGTEGAGRLVDHGGDDIYDGYVLGTGAVNGAAYFGAGALLDLAGKDTYLAQVDADRDHPHPTLDQRWPGPYAAENGEGIGGVGLLVDGDGQATYDPPPGAPVRVPS